MEKSCDVGREDEQMELPPGFRFHPTDEELITHYLCPKVVDSGFSPRAIGEVDLNRVEPWDLPWKAKMGEKEWYFFCVRDRKYPTGLRTNRATEAGYWKATGKDKEIQREKTLIGMKKTLVFYKGRAPRGQKTNWVMHEFRLEGKHTLYTLPKTAKNEWVVCRIFNKSSGGKKTHISGLVRLRNCGDELQPSNLPPLLDLSTAAETSYMTGFSESVEDRKPLEDMVDSCPSSLSLSKISAPNSFISTQIMPCINYFQHPDSFLMQEESLLKQNVLHNNGQFMKQNCRAEFQQDTGMSSDISSVLSHHEIQSSYEDQEFQFASAGPVDLDCLWNY